MEGYRDTAMYLYENNLMEKSQYSEFARDMECQREQGQKRVQSPPTTVIPPSFADYQSYLYQDQGP
jgi:hypothetical protein